MEIMTLFPTMAIVLLAFMALDVLTGLIAGARKRRLSSRISYKGMMKKAGSLIVIAVCFGLDAAFALNVPLAQAMTGFFLINEAISILENVKRMGVKLPPALVRMLGALQQEQEGRIDQAGNSSGNTSA